MVDCECVISVSFDLLKYVPNPPKTYARYCFITIDYAQQCDLYTCHASDLHPHKANNGVTKRPSSDVEELSSLDAASPRSLEGRNADKPSDDAAWCYPTKGPMACAKNYIASFDKGKIKTNACK